MRVVERHMETPAIVALTLADGEGRPLPAFAAGAHIDLELKPGLTRQYSLCNLPESSGVYRIAVLKDPVSQGGSIAAHNLSVGDLVTISEPRNAFPLIAGPHASVLLAGGIGVTPLLAMAGTLQDQGCTFELHYCARSPGQAAFTAELMSSRFADRVRMHFDDGPPDQHLDIDKLLASLDRSAHLYVCGPPGFIAWICGAAERRNWPARQIHREYFKNEALTVSGGGFTVKIASSGMILEVKPEQTLVHALKSAGIDVPVSCEAGVCGTCLIGVLEGVPDHRDLYLTADEKMRGDLILPCCSRAKTPQLVLDL